MDEESNWIATGIFGVLGLFSGIGAAISYSQYRKAKKRYAEAKKISTMTVAQAAGLKPTRKQYACVEGWTDKMNQYDKVMSFTYEHYLSIPGFHDEEYPSNKAYAPFNLRDKLGNSIYVAPSSKLHMSTLSRRQEQPYNWFNTLLSTIVRIGIGLGTVEYFVYDGDFVTLFGTISYDTYRKRVSLLPQLISSSGYTDIMSYLKQQCGLTPTVLFTLVFLTGAGLASFFGYRAYKQHIEAEAHPPQGQGNHPA